MVGAGSAAVLRQAQAGQVQPIWQKRSSAGRTLSCGLWEGLRDGQFSRSSMSSDPGRSAMPGCRVWRHLPAGSLCPAIFPPVSLPAAPDLALRSVYMSESELSKLDRSRIIIFGRKKIFCKTVLTGKIIMKQPLPQRLLLARRVSSAVNRHALCKRKSACNWMKRLTPYAVLL